MSFERTVLAIVIPLVAVGLLLNGCSSGGSDSARLESKVTVRGTVVSARSSEPLAEGWVLFLPIVEQSSDATAAPWSAAHVLELTDESARLVLTYTSEGTSEVKPAVPFGVTDASGAFEYTVPLGALQQHADWAVYVESRTVFPIGTATGFASRNPDSGPLIVKLSPMELSDGLVDLGQLKVTLTGPPLPMVGPDPQVW